MASLPTLIRMHIVTELACFATPQQVATSVKEKFGLTMSRQRIEAWHPERIAGARLDAKWRAVFYDTREKLLAALDDIPIACQAYRLRKLERMALQAESMGNLPLALLIIEQAAREAGGMYERRHAAPARSESTGAPGYRLQSNSAERIAE